jgi:hypothetical protein
MRTSFRFVHFAAAALVATAALVGSAKQAKADITYEFVNATFVGGGSLTGTFTTNDSQTTLISASVTAGAGGSFSSLTYQHPTAGVAGSVSPSNLFFLNPFANRQLLVNFASSLPTSGSVGIASAGENNFALSTQRLLNPGGSVSVVGGPAAAAPEPGTLALLTFGGLGMAGSIGMVARKRKAN